MKHWVWWKIELVYHESSIKKVIDPPKPLPLILKINDRLHSLLQIEWSDIVYSSPWSRDLLLIFGCMASTFMYLSFSRVLHSSFFYYLELIPSCFLAIFNKPPPLSLKPPSPLPLPSLIEDKRYITIPDCVANVIEVKGRLTLWGSSGHFKLTFEFAIS